MLGLSQTHMVGSGVQDYGNIRLGVMSKPMTAAAAAGKGYLSKFSHANETAAPGAYAVFLEGPGATVAVAACANTVASYELRWAAGAGRIKTVLLDAGASLGPGRVNGSAVTLDPGSACGEPVCPYEVSGSALMSGKLTGRNGRGVMVFFFAELLAASGGGQVVAPTDIGVWSTNGTVRQGAPAGHGKQLGAYASWADPDGRVAKVMVNMAISFVSIAQARANLAAGLPAPTTGGAGSFAACSAAATAAWDKVLGLVDIEAPAGGAWDAERTKFYTALYHMHQAPTTFSEAGGAYRGMDGKVHTLPRNEPQRYMSDMSIWDIFRTQVPFFALVEPDVAAAVVRSLVRMRADGGDFPKWPIASVYSGCMIGTHGNLILLDAAVKRVHFDSFDWESVYAGIRAAVTEPRPHGGRGAAEQADYIELGYVPRGKGYGNEASLTLAFSYDDWAVGTLAALLNKSDDAALFRARSTAAYRKQFEPRSQLMCPRTAAGEFACPTDPAFHSWLLNGVNGHRDAYCEGDAEEWRWYVPHDVPGLVGLYPSPASYAAALDAYFERTLQTNGTLLPNPYYWAGNEPGIFEPFQFNAAGRADLTQKWSRAVMAAAYSTEPDGVPGNDDFGALSSWYVWAALGLYPQPGKTQYVLGSPVFPEATVHLQGRGGGAGAALRIVAHGAGRGAVYVRNATINGKPVDVVRAAFVEHTDIADGGTLELWMGPTP